MATKTRAFWVGAFLLGGIAIAVIAIFWLGSASWLAKRSRYVTYIDGSVQGLNVDAEVKFRGVDVGRVATVEVARDGKLIEVALNLEPAFRVEDSLRAKLNYTGITGLKYVELSYPDREARLRYPVLTFKTPHPVIPSQPGGFEEIEQSLREVYSMLTAIDTEGISRRTNRFLDVGTGAASVVDSLVRSPEFGEMFHNLASATGQADLLLRSLQERRFDAKFDSALTAFHQGARRFDRTMATLEADAQGLRIADRTDSLFVELTTLLQASLQLVNRSQYGMMQMVYRVGSTMDELNAAIDQMNSLMMSIESYPSNVLYTAPPPKEK